MLSGCNGKIIKNRVPSGSIDFEGAVWISDSALLPVVDSLLYNDNPAPIFRKEFAVKKDIKSATLTITAAGYYCGFINGERIGKNYFDPAWTDYSKRIYYSEYNLTAKIKEGVNCIGVTLGNGFYNPLPLRMWGHLNLRNEITIGKPDFIARLKLEYSNGQTECVITDNSWKHSYGPIIKNSVYLGEVYDARREIRGWNKAGFDDKTWKESSENNGPGGQLLKTFFPHVQITGIKSPVSVSQTKDGKFIVDMGVNFTGHYRIRLKGEPGDTILFRFGERIDDNGELNPMTTVAGQIKRAGTGGPGAPAIAWQTDSYIFGDNTDTVFSPEFSYHTYRYMEISGLKMNPDLTDVEGIVFNSNVKNNNFSSSSELINSIQNASKRTFLANLMSVQSDCPAREKFGYGGDLNATSEAFIYNFDMHTFYRKTIYDWIDAMKDSIFVDTAPYVGIKYCGLSWESAYLITQYNLYLYYNDTELIRELYDLDLKWMEKAARIHPEKIVDAGLSDHESLEPVPVELTGTAHYLKCAQIMKTFASIMNDTENEERYENLANKLTENILDSFWRNPVASPINKQTLFSTLLYYDIIPEGEKKAAADSLMKALEKHPEGHFTTGIFGTKYILEALSKTGNTQTVFNIVNSTSYPGWGFMIDHGATTIWETWQESDNTYSNCHPMFGSVSEWLYRWLGGIRPDPDYPGFKKFIIAPSLPDGLEYVECSYNSPFGKIVSNWKRENNIKQVFELTIPEGSLALIKLPVNEQQKITIVRKIGNRSSPLHIDVKNYSAFELKSGDYTLSVTGQDPVNDRKLNTVR
jgi:alpha-L-rhamnosidase